MSISSNNPPQSRWYYSTPTGVPVGPIPLEELQRMARGGALQPDSYILEEGSSEWKPYASIFPSPHSSAGANQQSPSGSAHFPIPWPILLVLTLAFLFVGALATLYSWGKLGNLGLRHQSKPASLAMPGQSPASEAPSAAAPTPTVTLAPAPTLASPTPAATPASTPNATAAPTPAAPLDPPKSDLKGKDGLTSDPSKWRILQAGAWVYANEAAYRDAQAYQAEGNKGEMMRMSVEKRAFLIGAPTKAELLSGPNALGQYQIRYYGLLREEWFDMWIAGSAILPYSADLEQSGKIEYERKMGKFIKERALLKPYLWKTVRIKNGVTVFADIDAFWEAAELGNKHDMERLDRRYEKWLADSRVLVANHDISGLVTSIDDLEYLQVECRINGQKKSVWVLPRHVSIVSEEPNSPQSSRTELAQYESFRLGNFTYQIKTCKATTQVGRGAAKEQAGEGAAFVIVYYKILNEGTKTTSVISDDFSLLDAQGREFRVSSRASTAIILEGRSKKDFLISQLQPGVPKDMMVAFEIPKTAAESELTLIIPEKGPGKANQARVKLLLK